MAYHPTLCSDRNGKKMGLGVTAAFLNEKSSAFSELQFSNLDNEVINTRLLVASHTQMA